MTPELLTLAASVVALPGWRWVPGMLLTTGGRGCQATVYADGGILLDLGDGSEVTNELGDGGRRLTRPEESERDDPADAPLPDLTDAATGGCMLAMLGPCSVSSVPGSIKLSASDIQVLYASTLAEACASLALARGRWAT